MNYGEINLCCALLADIAGLKLPPKATSERLLLKVHYLPAMTDFMQARNVIMSDEASTDGDKGSAIKAKAEETVSVERRGFSSEAFEQIVTAAMSDGTEYMTSCLSKDGKMPTGQWLDFVAQYLIVPESVAAHNNDTQIKS